MHYIVDIGIIYMSIYTDIAHFKAFFWLLSALYGQICISSIKGEKMGRTKKGLVDEWRTADGLVLLEGWRRDGLTYDQISENMGINRATLFKWSKQYAEIRNALKKGEEVMVYHVENALYKAACGYDVTETDQTETLNEATGEKIITKHARKRHIPPNVGAICFILKNRRTEKWQDKPMPIDTTALDKLDAILKEARQAAENDVEPTETAEQESTNEIQPQTE